MTMLSTETDRSRTRASDPVTQRLSRRLPKRIDILAFDDVQLLDVTGPLQVFASVNQLVLRRTPMRASGEESPITPAADLPYVPRVIAAQTGANGGAVVTSAGLGVMTQPLPAADDPADTLIVAGGAGVDRACADRDLMAWLQGQARTTRRVASVCTGAFLLAQAGVLNQRRVVTHWNRCAELAQRFPTLQVDPDPIFIRSEDVWTSAGVTAGIDLALAMVEADLDRATALAVARDLVVFLKRPGGQSQFSEALALQTRSERFAALHEWMIHNVHGDLTVAALAARCGMSERSFVRHYRRETSMTPARAVERFRVDAARVLLEDSTMPLKRIAMRCGFGAEETLRRSFVKLLAVTPNAYRERFTQEAAPSRAP